MKYRKKPVMIEAVLWTGDYPKMYADSKSTSWFDHAVGTGTVLPNSNGTLSINTLEGVMLANIGDYIIQGINLELYPCKPDIFEKTYEVKDV